MFNLNYDLMLISSNISVHCFWILLFINNLLIMDYDCNLGIMVEVDLGIQVSHNSTFAVDPFHMLLMVDQLGSPSKSMLDWRIIIIEHKDSFKVVINFMALAFDLGHRTQLLAHFQGAFFWQHVPPPLYLNHCWNHTFFQKNSILPSFWEW